MIRGVRNASRIAAMLLPLGLVACQALIKSPGSCEDGVGHDGCPHTICEPKVTSNPTMHALASDLDHLEKHVDWYGSVVAKTPDVWGQARLTRYREEFEYLMNPLSDDNKFQVGLQGSLARSDQAFFAHATALSMAAQPKPPIIGSVVAKDQLVPLSHDVTVVRDTTSEQTVDGVKTTEKTTDTSKQGLPPPPPPTEGPIKLPDPVNAGSLIDEKGVIARNELLKERGIGFADLKKSGIGLEPSLYLAQKKRHIDFLNQLRRENEGDDTADSPAYSLNLIRIPVSVLPGKRTDVGHGAEVTMTLNPILGNDLLPMTFRNLVTNDLLHQLGFPLTQVLDDKGIENLLNEDAKNAIIALPVLNKINELRLAGVPHRDIQKYILGLSSRERDGLKQLAKLLPPADAKELKELVDSTEQFITGMAMVNLIPGQKMPEVGSRTFGADLLALYDKLDPVQIAQWPGIANTMNAWDAAVSSFNQKGKSYSPEKIRDVEKGLKAFSVKIPVPPMSYSAGLTNKTGFPTSQLIDVYGLSDCFQIAFAAYTALQESIQRQNYAHLPDVQGFLQQEIAAAYRFLAEPECSDLWHTFCTRDMVTAVRTRKVDVLQTFREQFRERVRTITRSGSKPYNELGEYSTTAALAWCVLVDSALLNDRLIRDMNEAASAKNHAPPPTNEAWPEYYLPEPPQPARTAFNSYVAMRWPVRVFALDPYSQDQNIADQFSSRREMQLALAIAFTNGYIGVNTLTKYTRRLEADFETIALNRTQIGFGHGENTFGWRFYPRFQTPDTESNLTVFIRDQLIGGPNRNALLRQRRLEPGPRECVAVVMMPSFVPYATLDVTSNWFGLANPKHKVLDHTQALKLSHTVHAIQNAGCTIQDANCYRNGELGRLLRRVEQLEARLPAQTLSVQVPVLNTLGGFEMFANGVTDLAPELYGWYGAPGVAATGKTTLFLVGDHFSPLNTKVIIGNQAITNPTDAKNETIVQRMLSRQVVQVTVELTDPTLTVLKNGKPHVTAHIATPYGVTRELLIPVFQKGETPKPAPVGFSVGDAKAAIRYALRPEANNNYTPVATGVSGDIKLKWDETTGTVAQEYEIQLEFELGGIIVPCSCGAKASANEKGELVIPEVEVQRVAYDLFQQKAIRDRALDGTLSKGLTTKTVWIVPKVPVGSGLVAKRSKANDQLTIAFQPEAYCKIELPPIVCPPAPPKMVPPNLVEPPKSMEPSKSTEKPKPGNGPVVAPPAALPLPVTPIPMLKP